MSGRHVIDTALVAAHVCIASLGGWRECSVHAGETGTGTDWTNTQPQVLAFSSSQILIVETDSSILNSHCCNPSTLSRAFTLM